MGGSGDKEGGPARGVLDQHTRRTTRRNGRRAAGQHEHKGIFITTSEFSNGALEYAKNLAQRVILIGGERLAELMIEHNIGVSRAYSYDIKRIDSDYFEED